MPGNCNFDVLSDLASVKVITVADAYIGSEPTSGVAPFGNFVRNDLKKNQEREN
jgi:hypothetical protein